MPLSKRPYNIYPGKSNIYRLDLIIIDINSCKGAPLSKSLTLEISPRIIFGSLLSTKRDPFILDSFQKYYCCLRYNS